MDGICAYCKRGNVPRLVFSDYIHSLSYCRNKLYCRRSTGYSEMAREAIND